ncbi:hypothetical protein F4775DRAFT_570520 [Biscogniauxia sp. FL1348]|nr:hypothetical protein F4775DRAFT_570520 [Biscogniauxia sp. FL1348]
MHCCLGVKRVFFFLLACLLACPLPHGKEIYTYRASHATYYTDNKEGREDRTSQPALCSGKLSSYGLLLVWAYYLGWMCNRGNALVFCTWSR